jgi:hypothetical protein
LEKTRGPDKAEVHFRHRLAQAVEECQAAAALLSAPAASAVAAPIA